MRSEKKESNVPGDAGADVANVDNDDDGEDAEDEVSLCSCV